MPTTRTRARYGAWLLLCAVALAACEPAPSKMTEQEATRMKKITQNMTSRCIGRYLIDMPADFVLNSQFSVTIEGVSIEIKPMTQAAFLVQFNNRYAKYVATVLPGKLKAPRLRAALDIPGSPTGAVFDLAKEEYGSDRMTRLLEAFGWKAGFAIQLQIVATDTTFPEDVNDSIAKQLHTDLPEKLAHLLSMYERVRGRADNEVPTEQGVCIHNGFVLGPPSDEEEVLVSYHLKDSQDVYFSLETASNFREDTNLLDRGRQIEAGAAEADGHTVRKGRHEAHGIKYDEWLLTGKTTDRVKGQLFSFEANSKLGNAKAPIIMITFHNGYRIPATPRTMEESAVLPEITQATLSEAESVALWDAVIPTLRPRPGAF